MHHVLLSSWCAVLWSLMCLGFTKPGLADDPAATCYYPDTGNIATGYFPCLSNTTVSACCPTGYSCYSSPLCIITLPQAANATNPLGTTIEPACTNPNLSGECKGYCPSNSSGPGDYLTSCGNNIFCCASAVGAGKCNCSNLVGSFSIPSGIFQTVVGFSGTPAPSTTMSQLPSTSSASTPTSSSVIISTPGTYGSSTGLSPGDKAGIATGVSVGGVLILAAAGFCLFRRKGHKGMVPMFAAASGKNAADGYGHTYVPQDILSHTVQEADPFYEPIPIFLGNPHGESLSSTKSVPGKSLPTRAHSPTLQYYEAPTESVSYLPGSFTGRYNRETSRSGQKVSSSATPDPYQQFTNNVSPPSELQ